MKKFVCELCQEGTLIKKDGLYVCQSCGTSYTLEDARKLLVDVPDTEVSEAAQPAAAAEPEAPKRSAELENLYELARRARKEDNSANGAKYYGMVLVQDPSSWEANFYSVYYTSMGCTIANIESAASNVANCIPSALDLIKKKVDPSEQEAAVRQIANDSGRIANMFAVGAYNAFTNFSAEYRANYWGDFSGRVGAAVLIEVALGQGILDRWPEEEWACLVAREVQSKGQSVCRTLDEGLRVSGIFGKSNLEKAINTVRSAVSDIGSSADKKLDKIRTKKRQEEAAAREAYWAEHAEQKEALEKEKEDLNAKSKELLSQIQTLRGKKQEVPSVRKVSELRDRSNELSAQMNGLGLFKGKEKKELQQRIEQIRQEINALSSKVTEEQAPIEEEIRDLEKQMSRMKARILEIDKEFSQKR